MLFTYLIVAVLLNGMGQPMPLWQIGGLWSLSYFVSLAPVSINGLGLQEVSIAYLYSHFGGVPMETGLVLAVMMRLVFLVASLPGAYFLATMGGLREPQNQAAITRDDMIEYFSGKTGREKCTVHFPARIS